jgi:Xaa-Pro aminopeptidase
MAKKPAKTEFVPVNEDDLKPGHRWDRPLQAPGITQVDFEERVEFKRLHRYRLARTRQALANSGFGAMLCFDQYNIRYISSTVIGEWARDKLIRYCLLTGNGDPWVWDFGSAARHHRINCPWLHEDHIRAGNPGMRGAIGPEVGLFKAAAKEIREVLKKEGVLDMPVGLDICEPPMLFALQEEGIQVVDGQQMMLYAREIKSHDEITLLNIASSMVDGVYEDIAEALKPGIKESQVVALATKRLYEMGSDCVEAINSAYFDIIHSFMGYRTCYYRTFAVGSSTQPQRDAYKRARQWMDDTIAMLKPGVSTEKAAKQLPKASEIGFESEMAAFGLNFCHGLGLGLHERPLISRLNSFIEPYELKAGMVFAVETFCPATDGYSAARIEEMVVLTPAGAKIISLYPAKELPVANRY